MGSGLGEGDESEESAGAVWQRCAIALEVEAPAEHMSLHAAQSDMSGIDAHTSE